MPRAIAQSLNLFPIDVSSTTLTEMLRMESLRGFEHSTILPGGFSQLSFTISVSQAEFQEWRDNRTLVRLLLEESGGRVIWEGRLEIIELLEFWLVKLTFVGYWANFTDAYRVDGSTTRNQSTTGDAAIQNLRDTHMVATVLQLSTSNAKMESPGVTLTIQYDDESWSVWKILTDSRKGIINIPNSSDQKMDLAVWEDRVIYYTARNPTVIAWESFIQAGVQRFPVRTNWQEVANSVIGRYDAAGTRTDGTVKTSLASITKYIRRERALPYLGDGSNATTANAQAASELALRSELQQQTDSLLLTRVWDANGVEFPLCRVRAGDVLRIPDFTPRTGDLGTLTLDAYRTFFIEQTTCDHTAGTLLLRPDRSGTSLSSILSKVGAAL